MTCKCCGEPGYWQRDTRLAAGGYVVCGRKRRGWSQQRYDENTLYRIEKILKHTAKRRRANLERRKAAFVNEQEGILGG